MPIGPIVDSHVHLYDPARIAYGWMKDDARLNRPHLIPEYDAARGTQEVEGIVFVEVNPDPGRGIAEATFVADLMTADPRIKAIVANVRLEQRAACAPELERLAALGPVRSIRRLLQHEPDAWFCLQPAFIEGVKLLPSHGFAFDICIYHHQLEGVIELVRQCPDVRFVLDHIGKPAIKAGLMEPWATHLRELAAFPNVWCKISGVATEADHAAWNEAQLRPYIEHALACFGFERAMFGSDWPVCTRALSWSRWLEMLDDVLTGTAPADLERFWRGNARRFYRLAV